jgi:carboxymethylenebutenolidase
MALAGYLAVAPDALSPQGGTPTDADKAREMFQAIDAAKNLNNFVNAIDYARSRPDCSGKVGTVGFCWGGRMANQLAVSAPTLNAAVAYYGSQPTAEAVPQIKAAVQLHYAGLDERINAGIPAYEEALKKNGITYELYMYDGAQHAFNNDTAPTRYNEAAAKLAWERTMAFFQKHLR